MSDGLESSITPAERRRSKVRNAILDAAERMFMRDGEAGLSIRKIADEIDYTPGAIYKYFESKQDLIDELKEAFFEILLAEMNDFSGPPEDYPAYAHQFLNAYIKIALAKPHHYAAAFTGVKDEDVHIAEPASDSLKVQAFMGLLDMVQTGVDIGVFRQDLDITLTAKSIWASMHGLASLISHIPDFHRVMSPDNDLSEEAFIARHISFILRGLFK